MSPNYLRSLFKEATGKTILEYNTEMRLQRAAELLKNKKNKVREVSLAVGYENVSYFGVVYRNGDECPDGSGNACRMRIKWQYIIKYCIRQCIICIGRGINRRSYDFYL